MPKFDIKSILEGWKSYLVEDATSLKQAQKRASHCITCPDLRHGKVLALLKDEGIKQIKGMYCGVCGCPLSAALRSKSYKCPKNRWNDE